MLVLMGADQRAVFERPDTEAIPVSPIEDDATGPITSSPERLVCVVGEDMGRTFPIGTHPTIIGRGERGIDLRASDVSRRHARVWRERSAVFVEDLESSNGTYVNGVPVRDEPVQLALGDRIQFASAIFVFTRHDELEERLKQLEKLDAMHALVKGLAHDFNNMLSVLRGGLDVIADRWPAADPDLAEVYAEMDHAVGSASGLVRRLMRIGRAKPPTMELVRLEQVIEQALAMSRHMGLDRVRITTKLDGDARVLGSREELVQVFVNLIVNARDAMPDGGNLAISATVHELDRATALSLHLPAEGAYVDLSLADSGRGMDEATLSRIFEPFFTTKPLGKGSGLGLAMVYSSIRNHRGAVYAESTLGRGTTFRVLLPVAR